MGKYKTLAEKIAWVQEQVRKNKARIEANEKANTADRLTIENGVSPGYQKQLEKNIRERDDENEGLRRQVQADENWLERPQI